MITPDAIRFFVSLELELCFVHVVVGSESGHRPSCFDWPFRMCVSGYFPGCVLFVSRNIIFIGLLFSRMFFCLFGFFVSRNIC